MKLRSYQQKLKTDILSAWENSSRNILAVLPTGGGKTMVFANIAAEHEGRVCIIAHRQELVCQISAALCQWGTRHDIIAPPNVVREAVRGHIELTGHSVYASGSSVTVCGVDTLVRRSEKLRPWARNISLWIQDEAHHVLAGNKWGTAAAMFPNACGLGVTATPLRADGRGLGRHHDGVMDILVEGPTMRALIDQGNLSDYRIYAPPTKGLNLGDVRITAAGEYSPPQVKSAVQHSSIMGDIVSHYQKLAAGKLGVTFVSDVETASLVAQRFNAAGVPAAMVCAKTPSAKRAELIRQFKRRELLMLVNVALFDEGFDLPAIEVVIMAQPTASYGRYCQQFGRALRLVLEKKHAIIIDHVGNVMRHGLPDAPRVWTLDRRDRRKKTESVLKIRVCPECLGVYERFHSCCPECGYRPVPTVRSSPKHVDGDLVELDPDVLSAMRGEVERIDAPDTDVRDRMLHCGATAIAANSAAKHHRKRQEAQSALREAVAVWAGKHVNGDQRAGQRLFYHTFDIDVLSALALGRADAQKLTKLIEEGV